MIDGFIRAGYYWIWLSGLVVAPLYIFLATKSLTAWAATYILAVYVAVQYYIVLDYLLRTK